MPPPDAELEHFGLDKVFAVSAVFEGVDFLWALGEIVRPSVLLALLDVELATAACVLLQPAKELTVVELLLVVDVGISCLISFLSNCGAVLGLLSVLLGVLERFSEITGDGGGVKCLFLALTHFSQSSVSGLSEMRLGHALHVVHKVSMKVAKLSSSFMRSGEGIFTYKMTSFSFCLLLVLGIKNHYNINYLL